MSWLKAIVVIFLCTSARASSWSIEGGSPIHVACLGDSITQGTPETNYPHMLAEDLGDNFQVANHGVSGAALTRRSFKPVWDLDEFHDLLESEPDTVVVMLGTNDVSILVSNDVLADYETDLVDLVTTLQSLPSTPDVLLCYPPPLYAASETEDDRLTSTVIPAIDNVAQQYGLKVIDVYTGVTDYPDAYTDGRHPDESGLETIAGLIQRRIEEK